jgi:transposase
MERGRRINNIPKEQTEAEKLYIRGFQKSTIAANLDVSLMTIYRWAHKYKWEEAYKQKYDEELSKITDEEGKLIFKFARRIPKLK